MRRDRDISDMTTAMTRPTTRPGLVPDGEGEGDSVLLVTNPAVVMVSTADQVRKAVQLTVAVFEKKKHQ